MYPMVDCCNVVPASLLRCFASLTFSLADGVRGKDSLLPLVCLAVCFLGGLSFHFSFTDDSVRGLTLACRFSLSRHTLCKHHEIKIISPSNASRLQGLLQRYPLHGVGAERNCSLRGTITTPRLHGILRRYSLEAPEEKATASPHNDITASSHLQNLASTSSMSVLSK